jgi:hypothetical protein
MLVILNLVGHCSIFYVVFKELQNLERQNNIQFRKKKYLDTQIKINETINLELVRQNISIDKNTVNYNYNYNINEIMKCKFLINKKPTSVKHTFGIDKKKRCDTQNLDT